MRERVVVRQKKGVGLEGDGTRFAGKGRNGSIRRSISQPNDDDNIHQGMAMFQGYNLAFWQPIISVQDPGQCKESNNPRRISR